MICPYCHVAVHADYPRSTYREEGEDGAQVAHGLCPACKRLIVTISRGRAVFRDGEYELADADGEEVVYPPFRSVEVDQAVPTQLRDDLNEAAAVAKISPRASAALCRRILQTVLREHYEIRERNLEDEIDVFISRADIPRFLRDSVDAVRQIGNFAAHPLKARHTGQIVDTEPGEAEWCIEVIQALFEATFVQPDVTRRRRDRLNSKLAELGKPLLKTSPEV